MAFGDRQLKGMNTPDEGLAFIHPFQTKPTYQGRTQSEDFSLRFGPGVASHEPPNKS